MAMVGLVFVAERRWPLFTVYIRCFTERLIAKH